MVRPFVAFLDPKDIYIIFVENIEHHLLFEKKIIMFQSWAIPTTQRDTIL